MIVVRGMVLTWTNAQPVSGVDLTFMNLGRAILWGMPLPGLIFAAALALGHVLLTYHKSVAKFTRWAGTRKSARSSGINTSRLKLISYMICSASAGIAEVVLASRLNTGSPIIGENTARST